MAFDASANTLANGSFETQPPAGTSPDGWVSLDGTYWRGLTDDPSKTNSVFKLSSTIPAEGDCFIRRTLFSGTGVSVSSYWSTYYNMANLPTGTTVLQLDVQTINRSATADAGKHETYGTIVFYDGGNGTGSILATYETERFLAQNTDAGWHLLTGTFVIPTGAASYKVGASVAVNEVPTTTNYANFDHFVVTAIISGAEMANGSFETQPPAGTVPDGWTSLDGIYWEGQTDDASKTNNVFKQTGTVPAEGDFFIHRKLFAGTGVSVSSYWSFPYEIPLLPDGTTSLQLDLQSANVTEANDSGKSETYGAIVFYTGVNGTGSALATNETGRLPGGTDTGWHALSGIFAIPVGAKSYRLGACIAVNGELASIGFSRFDDFVSTPLLPAKPPSHNSSGLMFNLLHKGLNLDFRYGSEGWSGIDGLLWRLTSDARSHESALQRVLEVGTPASAVPFEVSFSEPLPVEEGESWLAEGYVKIDTLDAGIETALRLRFFNQAGQPVGLFDTPRRTPPLNPHFNNYSRIAGITLVPAGAVTAKLSALVFVNATLAEPRSVSFDDLQVGAFDAMLSKAVSSAHAAPKPPPIQLDPESGGPVTQGILSLGKFYQCSPPLNGFADRDTNTWTDGTILTDGDIQTGPSFTNDQYVGWQADAPTSIVFDLGRLQGLETVRVHSMQHSASNLVWPWEVRVRTRADRTGSWADWATFQSSAYSGSGAQWQTIGGSAPRTWALEVEVTLIPDAAHAADTMLASEIELVGAIKNSWRNVPSEGVYHGAFPPNYGFDASLLGGRDDKMRLDLFEWLVGKPLAMVLWYQNMEPGRNFEEIQEIRRRYLSENFYGNRILTLGWLPPQTVSLANIAEGQYDAFFERYFRDSVDPVVLMGNDSPIWFRPMNEFNTTWVPYGNQPEMFRKAWRRIYNIAEKVGAAQKHLFVWGPNHRSYPDEPWNYMENYWPGDQYVDWVGISCYPPSLQVVGTEDSRYPLARFEEVYEKYGHYKSLMVTEGGFGNNVDKTRWVDEWFQIPAAYTNVRAFIWENHFDRSIQTDVESQILYREEVQDAAWIPTTYAE